MLEATNAKHKERIKYEDVASGFHELRIEGRGRWESGLYGLRWDGKVKGGIKLGGPLMCTDQWRSTASSEWIRNVCSEACQIGETTRGAF